MRRATPPGAPLDLSEGVDVMISCAGWLPDRHWQDVDEHCATAGIAWHRCHLDGGRLRVGPMVVPGDGVRYRDVRARRLAASPVPEELRELWAHLDTGTNLPAPPWPGPGQVAVAAGLLVADVLAHLAGNPVPGAGRELTVGPGEVVRHPVLPLPVDTGRPGSPVPVSSLVDPRFGVVTRLRREQPADVPAAFVSYTAELANTREFAPWTADAVTGGAAWGDPERARAAALGEAVERYCGNAVPADLVIGSAADLAATGRDVLDPTGLALYSATQYATPGFPFVPFGRELETAWATGRDLHGGGPILVPAALTYLNGPGTRPGEHPAISTQAFAGIAAGPSVAAAERAALEELLERDAVTLWWYSGAPARALRADHDPRLALLRADTVAAGLDPTFLAIPCPFDVPVIGVFLEDHERGVVAFGTACRPTPVAAAEKALCEALVTYTVSRELAAPDSEFWAAVSAGRLRARPYRPWRADRHYRDDYRSDWRDLTHLDPNVQLYLDPRMRDAPLRRLRNPVGEVDLAPVDGDPRDAYLRALAATGLPAVSVNLTTPDVAAAGLRVVRVVVGGLYQLAPAAFPLLGGTRLYTEPVTHGWVPGPLTEDDLVRHPLPFA
ncbi:YcaO-like family protein [Amycolatopsis arida]|uniref:YcaO-like family protein n=1 Tax=Amycolatopsis arida TaxID=587909 RepID=UPI001AB02B7B|nr:YcaO-like family protein [Amycolatopsis arida]